MPFRAIPVAAGAMSMLFMGSVHALADEEVLLRHDLGFSQCRTVVHAFLADYEADPAHVTTEADTGAHYRVKLSSADANLLFRCNAVSQQIAVIRITPGDLGVVSENTE